MDDVDDTDLTVPPSAGEAEERRYDAVIIGAGIGGLTCGALLAREGLDVLVLERRDRPGGFVTDHARKDFSFQVPSTVGGLGPGGDLTRLMERLDMRLSFKKVDPYQRYIYPDHDVLVPCDPAVYLEVLKESFLPQTANLKKLFEAIQRIASTVDMKEFLKASAGRPTPGKLARTLRHPGIARHVSRRASFQKLLDEHLTDDRLKTILGTACTRLGALPWQVSSLSVVALMKGFYGGAHFPAGGFGAMSEAFANALTEAGGTLLYGQEVLKVNVEEGRVVTVDTEAQPGIRAAAVISDADTRSTFLRLLDPEDLTGAFVEAVETRAPSHSGFTMHLGLAGPVDLREFAGGTVSVRPTYDHSETLEAISSVEDYPDPEKLAFDVTVHSLMDPSLAPEDKACLSIQVPGVPYRFMERWGVGTGGLKGRRYKGVSEKYAEIVVEAVRRAFPGLVEGVQAYDIATPVTYEQATMAYDGCWYDLAPGPRGVFDRPTGPATPVHGLYLTGSKSLLGGGIYAAAMNGVLAANAVLKGKLGSFFG